MRPPIHLITRADDAGGCRSANEAILECVEAGTTKNVSFMAVGPEIEHAAELLRGHSDIAVGLHVCLNAEWERVKWGPLTDAPELCDEDRHFLPFPSDTKARIEGGAFDKRDLRAIVGAEINAQLRRLRELGLKVSYVDEHMGVSWIAPEFRAVIADLCRLHGFVDASTVPFLPHGAPSPDDFVELEARLEAATETPTVWVTHPGKVALDMEAFHLAGDEPGVIARERDAERRLLLDPRLPGLFNKWSVKLARYDGG